MTLRRSSLLLLLIPFATLAISSPSQAQSASNLGEPQPTSALPSNSTIVYVSDFDLDVLYSKMPRRPPPRTSPPATGYNARRPSAGAALPKLGLRIRGVFAEADERNRARRLLVGGEPVGPNMLLFVGVNNLARQEQPLYELATPPANDPRHGPIITVTSYAPATRFELSRDPSGEELQKIATQIVADLTALLNANRLSLSQ